jgi:hypothetical protein
MNKGEQIVTEPQELPFQGREKELALFRNTVEIAARCTVSSSGCDLPFVHSVSQALCAAHTV